MPKLDGVYRDVGVVGISRCASAGTRSPASGSKYPPRFRNLVRSEPSCSLVCGPSVDGEWLVPSELKISRYRTTGARSGENPFCHFESYDQGRHATFVWNIRRAGASRDHSGTGRLVQGSDQWVRAFRPNRMTLQPSAPTRLFLMKSPTRTLPIWPSSGGDPRQHRCRPGVVRGKSHEVHLTIVVDLFDANDLPEPVRPRHHYCAGHHSLGLGCIT